MYSSLRAQSVTAGVTPVDQITVQGMTLDSILSQVGAPASIDFVSIDVEGHEIDVLDGFDLARWLPKILVVEDLLMSSRLNRYLKARGYKWFRRTGLNGWYAPRGHEPDGQSIRSMAIFQETLPRHAFPARPRDEAQHFQHTHRHHVNSFHPTQIMGGRREAASLKC
jgi:hypothetical protein